MTLNLLNRLSNALIKQSQPAPSTMPNNMPASNHHLNTHPQTTSSTNHLRNNFWQRYSLNELTHQEWEALCDGCGVCCLVKFLEYEDEPESVEYTDVACKLLDCDTGYCSDYPKRQHFVPDCISLSVEMLASMMWLPSSCAYKRLYLGQDLPDWHLLITQDVTKTKQGMKKAGVGVAGRCVSEVGMSDEDMEDRIVRWVEV